MFGALYPCLSNTARTSVCTEADTMEKKSDEIHWCNIAVCSNPLKFLNLFLDSHHTESRQL